MAVFFCCVTNLFIQFAHPLGEIAESKIEELAVVNKDKRQHIRTKLRSEVELSHPEVGNLKLHTGDISNGGAYILTEGNALPSVGEMVLVQVQGLGGADASVIKMKIVRSDSEGIGLEFVSDDAAPDR